MRRASLDITGSRPAENISKKKKGTQRLSERMDVKICKAVVSIPRTVQLSVLNFWLYKSQNGIHSQPHTYHFILCHQEITNKVYRVTMIHPSNGCTRDIISSIVENIGQFLLLYTRKLRWRADGSPQALLWFSL